MAREASGLQRVFCAPLAGPRRLRRDRLVDLLRARHRGPLRARPDALGAARRRRCSSCSSRSRTPRASPRCPRPVGRRHSSVARSTTRPASSPAGCCFLDYLVVDRARRALRSALPRHGPRLGPHDGKPWDVVIGRRRDRPHRSCPARAAGAPDSDRGRASPVIALVVPARSRSARAGLSRSRRKRSAWEPTSAARRPGTTSPSRSRSRRWRTPASRRSRTSPPKPASRDRRFLEASSSASAPSSPCTS